MRHSFVLVPARIGLGVLALSLMASCTGQDDGGASATTSASAYLTSYDQASQVQTVWRYAIDSGGQLHRVDAPAAVGSGPGTLVLDPAGRSAYLSNPAAGTMAGYHVQTDGSLRPIGGSGVVAGATPGRLVFAPSGAYAYLIPDGSDSIAMFGVDASGGLSPLTLPARTAPGHIDAMAVDPGGRFLYATGNWGISRYAISANGSLASGQVLEPLPPSAISVSRLLIEPTGHYAYAVANNALIGHIQTMMLHIYAIDAGGGLAEVNQPAQQFPSISNIMFDPGGGFVSIALSAAITRYSVSATGALTAVSTTEAGAGVYSMAWNSDRRFLYALNSSEATISQFAVRASGSLSSLATPKVAAPDNATAIAIAP